MHKKIHRYLCCVALFLLTAHIIHFCITTYDERHISRTRKIPGPHFIPHSEFIDHVSLDLESNVTMQLFGKPSKTFSKLRSSFVRVTLLAKAFS